MNKPSEYQTTKSKALLFTGNIALVFTAVYCTFGALLSSFSIVVNTSALLWLWLISAIVITISVTLYRIKSLPVFMVPALLLFLWNISEIIDGGMWVINKITSTYGMWLSVTALFPESADRIYEPTAFIAAAGILITILTAFAICLRRSTFITVIITAPIIFLTFIITDLQADVVYLLGVVAVYLTLLISSSIAPDNYIKRGLITLPAMAISIGFMLFVFLLSPPGNYARSEQIVVMGNNFRTFASQLGRLGQYWQDFNGNYGISWAGTLGGGNWQFNTNSVSISGAGTRYITNISLLEINVDNPGTFYIRGYSMGDFDGNSWGKDPAASPRFEIQYSDTQQTDPESWLDLKAFDDMARDMPFSMAAFYSNVNPYYAPVSVNMSLIRTGDSTNIYYSPYYSSRDISAREAFFYIDNVHSLYERLTERGYHQEFYDYINDGIQRRYTYVDESTAQGLRRLANEAGIYLNADRAYIADAVARYIISSGSYTLTPGQIPGDVDFALYFLEELNEGYCIHFATAAVLMLRSLDIPARFTSGYATTISRDEVGRDVVLTDANAHAWVEVYYDNIGWLYLEVTPPGGDTYIPRQRPHSPPLNNEPTPEVTPQPSPTPPVNIVQPTPEDPQYGDQTPGISSGAGRQNILNLPQWLYNLIIIVLCIILLIIALVIRRRITNQLRIKRFQQEDTNKAAIQIWRYIKQLSRREAVPPNDIEDLVLKARFSQHKLTEKERSELIKYANTLAYEVYSGKGDYSRLWLRYIRALY